MIYLTTHRVRLVLASPSEVTKCEVIRIKATGLFISAAVASNFLISKGNK